MINNRTNYSIVRFGDVIGSSGSVIPKFINQISSSNQLTLSHKKVKNTSIHTRSNLFDIILNDIKKTLTFLLLIWEIKFQFIILQIE